jgi:hypothetical protein
MPRRLYLATTPTIPHQAIRVSTTALRRIRLANSASIITSRQLRRDNYVSPVTSYVSRFRSRQYASAVVSRLYGTTFESRQSHLRNCLSPNMFRKIRIAEYVSPITPRQLRLENYFSPVATRHQRRAVEVAPICLGTFFSLLRLDSRI